MDVLKFTEFVFSTIWLDFASLKNKAVLKDDIGGNFTVFENDASRDSGVLANHGALSNINVVGKSYRGRNLASSFYDLVVLTNRE